MNKKITLLLILSFLLISCGPTNEPATEPTTNPTTEQTPSKLAIFN